MFKGNRYCFFFSGLLCGAIQFQLPDLAGACWEHIDDCLKSGRGEGLLPPTRAYSEHKAAQLIFDRVGIFNY